MLVASEEATRGLGHGEAGADLALQQRVEPLALLRLGAVAVVLGFSRQVMRSVSATLCAPIGASRTACTG